MALSDLLNRLLSVYDSAATRRNTYQVRSAQVHPLPLGEPLSAALPPQESPNLEISEVEPRDSNSITQPNTLEEMKSYSERLLKEINTHKDEITTLEARAADAKVTNRMKNQEDNDFINSLHNSLISTPKIYNKIFEDLTKNPNDQNRNVLSKEMFYKKTRRNAILTGSVVALAIGGSVPAIMFLAPVGIALIIVSVVVGGAVLFRSIGTAVSAKIEFSDAKYSLVKKEFLSRLMEDELLVSGLNLNNDQQREFDILKQKSKELNEIENRIKNINASMNRKTELLRKNEKRIEVVQEVIPRKDALSKNFKGCENIREFFQDRIEMGPFSWDSAMHIYGECMYNSNTIENLQKKDSVIGEGVIKDPYTGKTVNGVLLEQPMISCIMQQISHLIAELDEMNEQLLTKSNYQQIFCNYMYILAKELNIQDIRSLFDISDLGDPKYLVYEKFKLFLDDIGFSKGPLDLIQIDIAAYQKLIVDAIPSNTAVEKNKIEESISEILKKATISAQLNTVPSYIPAIPSSSNGRAFRQ